MIMRRASVLISCLEYLHCTTDRCCHELFTDDNDGIFNHYARGDHSRYTAGAMSSVPDCS
jgi:hypothetical protein